MWVCKKVYNINLFMHSDYIQMSICKEESKLLAFPLFKGNHYTYFGKHSFRYHFLCVCVHRDRSLISTQTHRAILVLVNLGPPCKPRQKQWRWAQLHCWLNDLLVILISKSLLTILLKILFWDNFSFILFIGINAFHLSLCFKWDLRLCSTFRHSVQF